jgi:hypothetical protein
VTATALPAVLDALVDQLGAAMPPDAETVDGYAYADSAAVQLIIGVSDPVEVSFTPAAASRLEPLGDFSGATQEIITVACRLVVLPEDNLRAARASLVAYLDLVDAALAADRTLGGIVQSANRSDFTLNQSGGPSGEGVRLDFSIVADTYHN